MTTIYRPNVIVGGSFKQTLFCFNLPGFSDAANAFRQEAIIRVARTCEKIIIAKLYVNGMSPHYVKDIQMGDAAKATHSDLREI